MSEKAFCIACRKTDDSDNLYHVEHLDVYIHEDCLTQEWVDKLNLEVDEDNVVSESGVVTANEISRKTEVSQIQSIVRFLGIVIMGAAFFGIVGVGHAYGMSPLGYIILFATVWLTGLAMLLR